MSRFVINLLCTVMVLIAHAAAIENPRRAVALKQISEKRLTPAQIESICSRLSKPCKAESTTAWAAGAGDDGKIYLIDSAYPMLILREPGATSEAEPRYRQWDFSEYQHSTLLASDGSDAKSVQIYPALYPAGQSDTAVALLSQASEMYSGGGAQFAVADFVVLGDTSKPKVVYAAIPFSCNKLVRACFSPRDYNTSPHCHDENNGYLTIQFPAHGAWQFIWHEQDWPSNVSARHAKHTQTKLVAPEKGADSSGNPPWWGAEFCGGPMS